MQYPRPDRSGFTPNFTKTPENDVLDVGWAEGRLADGRPYRMECWAQDGLTCVTYFMSAAGLEDFTMADFVALLAREGLVTFLAKDGWLCERRFTDSRDHDLWSVNLIVGDEDTLYVNVHVPLLPYRTRRRNVQSPAGMRTSATDPIKVGWLPLRLNGKVGLTFAPGKNQADAQTGAWARDLAMDLEVLRRVHDARHLVCLLEDHELDELGIRELPIAAVAVGMEFHRLPIADGSLPVSADGVRALAADVVGWAAAGENVVIHCKGGLGRAGTVGGCVLRAAGMEPAGAFEALHEARGRNCPETGAQRQYIAEFVPGGPSRRSRVLGSVIAAAAGDALGHPTEFLRSTTAIRRAYPPAGVAGYELYWDRGGRHFAPYTDDTQMAEIVLRALVRRAQSSGTLEAAMKDTGDGFAKWAENPQGGHRAPGNACLAGAHRLGQGVPWREAGGMKAGGCGSVMRVYPFGLLLGDDLETAERWAVDHSRMTHQAPIALAACAAMAIGVALELRGTRPDAVSAAMIEAAGRHDAGTARMMSGALDDARAGREPDDILERLQGWAAHEAIAAAMYVVSRHPDDLRAALLEGANAPGDSDSIATLAGALLGARLGLERVPPEWVRDLERSDELVALGNEAAAAIRA